MNFKKLEQALLFKQFQTSLATYTIFSIKEIVNNCVFCNAETTDGLICVTAMIIDDDVKDKEDLKASDIIFTLDKEGVRHISLAPIGKITLEDL